TIELGKNLKHGLAVNDRTRRQRTNERRRSESAHSERSSASENTNLHLICSLFPATPSAGVSHFFPMCPPARCGGHPFDSQSSPGCGGVKKPGGEFLLVANPRRS